MVTTTYNSPEGANVIADLLYSYIPNVLNLVTFWKS